MAWEREEVSLASVAWVVRFRLPASTRVRKSDGSEAWYSSRPVMTTSEATS